MAISVLRNSFKLQRDVRKLKKDWSLHKAAINTKYRDYLSYQCKIIICVIKMLLPTALLRIPPTSNFWITNVFIMYAAHI